VSAVRSAGRLPYITLMRLPTLLLLLVLLAFPAGATAQRQNVPPGNSEVDQYVESVPDGTGNSTVTKGERNGVVDAATRAELEALGPDGALAADLAESTGAKGTSGEGERLPRGIQVDEPQTAVLPGLSEALSGSSDGLGILLPLLLLGTLILSAFAVARRRSAH
jgi:hypothetical protein